MKDRLFNAPKSPYRVPYDASFRIARASTTPPRDVDGKKALKAQLREQVEGLAELQRKLYADDRYSLLLVFQAMDAAGKDGTIRAVMSGINPAGCQVHAFKRPSPEELDHDFMWRIYQRLPERGRIGIFNRSHYEEVLAVRVHPEFLVHQKLPRVAKTVWSERLESIADFERHLARNGTVILKFFLNVSQDEQRRRLLARIDEPDSNWKFEGNDVHERAVWPKYMRAFQGALNATSHPFAPWYSIPADDKPFMRLTVAKIVRQTLEGLGLEYPKVSDETRAELGEFRAMLTDEEQTRGKRRGKSKGKGRDKSKS